MDAGSYLLVILICLVAQVAVSLAHGALTNIRPGSLREHADEGQARARHALTLLNAHAKLRLTYAVSRVMLISLTSATLTLLLLEQYPMSDPREQLFIYGIVLLVAMLLVIVGDVVPESIGNAQTEALLPFAVPFLRLLVLLFSPLTLLLLAASKVLASAFGSSALVETVTEEEIMTLVSAGHSGGTIEEEEKDMIYSVLQLDQTWARELMTPRLDIVALPVDASLNDALKTFTETGFSRVPVYEDNMDNIVGLLYAKDLLALWQAGNAAAHKAIRDLARPAHFVPETKRADELLREMQNRNVHLVIVVDEYGGTSGLVTIENLIEEIVGDIRDEYDLHEEAEYVQTSSDDYLIDASMNIDDFNELLESNLSDEDNDTLGGFIFTRLGRMPMVGDIVETDEVTLRIVELDGRRIRKVRATRKVITPDEPAAADASASSSDADMLPNAS